MGSLCPGGGSAFAAGTGEPAQGRAAGVRGARGSGFAAGACAFAGRGRLGGVGVGVLGAGLSARVDAGVGGGAAFAESLPSIVS